MTSPSHVVQRVVDGLINGHNHDLLDELPSYRPGSTGSGAACRTGTGPRMTLRWRSARRLVHRNRNPCFGHNDDRAGTPSSAIIDR